MKADELRRQLLIALCEETDSTNDDGLTSHQWENQQGEPEVNKNDRSPFTVQTVPTFGGYGP
jgi:hypothetical protein